MMNKLKLKWKFEWRYIPRDIKIGCINIVKWFKLIWSDRNWDHTFLLKLMKLKIELMADYHESRKFYVGWENNVKWMRTVSKLLDRSINAYYEFEVLDYYDKDFEFVPIEGSEYSTMESELNWEKYDEYLDKYQLQIPIVKRKLQEINTDRDYNFDKLEDKEALCWMLSYHNQRRCDGLIFKILSEHIRSWWD